MSTQSEPSESSSSRTLQTKPKTLPTELSNIVWSSLGVGAGAGACGLLVGATYGIARTTTPVLWSLFSGIQWFTLGSSYYASRRIAITTCGGDEKMTPRSLILASAFAGTSAGVTASLIRGPKNVVHAALVWSLCGAAGQFAFEKWTARQVPEPRAKKSWLDSKWSLVKKLSDEEYAEILSEKVLGLEADIAITDEKLAALREQKQKQPQTSTEAANSTPSAPDQPKT